MLTRRFGRTELAMPAFSCGGMRFQHSWDRSQWDRVTDASQRNLEAIVEHALALGINHFETARAYGTSEHQLGRILPRLPRDEIIVQTKASPLEDPAEFRAGLEDSLEQLGLERIDLFGFHGLNNPERIDQTIRDGGCYEVARELQAAGRIGHIGFSTHAPTETIIDLCQSGRFAYVNLHWYYINQENWPAIEAAAAEDMGVFIISPSYNGGKLFGPPEKLRELCRPFSPAAFNDLFCLGHPEVKTLSVGAARPGDLDEHAEAIARLETTREEVEEVAASIANECDRALGPEYARTWREGLPAWSEVPGEVNVKAILHLGNLAKALDLVDFARERYRLMQTGGGHWYPGKTAGRLDYEALEPLLAASPNAELIPALLREYHALLFTRLTLKERLKPGVDGAIRRLRHWKGRLRRLLSSGGS